MSKLLVIEVQHGTVDHCVRPGGDRCIHLNWRQAQYTCDLFQHSKLTMRHGECLRHPKCTDAEERYRAGISCALSGIAPDGWTADDER